MSDKRIGSAADGPPRKEEAVSSRRRRIRDLPLVVTLMLTTSGCVGVLEPIFAADDRPQSPADFTQAIGYANEAKDNYFSALQNQARLSTWVGAGLVPLAAVATGFVMFGKTTTATYLGLAGAGTWATATWLRNQPAQMAYLSGYEAVNCAIVAVVPFAAVDAAPVAPAVAAGASLPVAPPTTARAPQPVAPPAPVDAAPRTFREALGLIDGQIADVRSALASAPADDPNRAAAERLLADAEEARTSGHALAAATRSLPDLLVATVDRIQAEVGRQVAINQPDIAALSGIIGGIGAAYGTFGQVSPTGVKPTQPKSPPKGVSPDAARDEATASNVLVQDMGKLATSQAIIAATVSAVVSQKPTEALKACKVDAAQVASALTVTPSDRYEFAAKTASRKGFVVSGGTSPYVAQVADAERGVTVSSVEAFGAAFVIAVRADAEAGEHPILISDITGRKRFIEAIVAGTSRTESQQNSPRAGCAEIQPNPVAACSPPSEIVQLQRAVCVPRPDGRWGIDSQKYFEDYERRELGQDPPAKQMTADLKKRLLKLAEEPMIAHCPPQEVLDELEALAGWMKSGGSAGQDDTIFKVESASVKIDTANRKVTLRVCRGIGSPVGVPPTISNLQNQMFQWASESQEDAGHKKFEILKSTDLLILGDDNKELDPTKIKECAPS